REVAGRTSAQTGTAHAGDSGGTAVRRELDALRDTALLRLDLDGDGFRPAALRRRDLERVLPRAPGEHVPSLRPALEELLVARAEPAHPNGAGQEVDVPGVPHREREAAAMRRQLLDATLDVWPGGREEDWNPHPGEDADLRLLRRAPVGGRQLLD